MSNSAFVLRKKILTQVKKFYQKEFSKKKFIPGETPISYSGRVFDERDLIYLVDAALDFWLTSGRYAQEFERKLAAFIGVKYASFVNSGSSANLLAISALMSPLLKSRRLKAGDEIITTALNFPTTITPIIQNRLVPVFVDIELGKYNASIEAIKIAISRKTKAVFLMHTLGNPFNLEEVRRICARRNLWLIEDNCDALGSRYSGAYTGSFGDLSTFSFYPAHHITTGEGGAVLTDNLQLNKIVTSLRDWGRDCWCQPGRDNTCGRRFSGKYAGLPEGYDHKYVYSHLGYNFKATDMQAAIGIAQLEKFPEFIKAREKNHRYLYERLKHLTGSIILPSPEKDSIPCWFGFPITLRDNAKKTRREMLNALEKNKIQTRLFFAGNITRQPCFLHLKKGCDYRTVGALKNTDKAMRDGFWLGVYPGLSKGMLDFMADNVRSFLEK